MNSGYQNATSKLDVSVTSSNSSESTTYVPISRGTYSPLHTLAEHSIDQLSLADMDHDHSQEDEDPSKNTDMDANHEKDIEFNEAATSHEGAANHNLIESDQKHKRPVQAMTKSWSQHSSVHVDTNRGDGADSQIFFASRASFWVMVAAHGLPSTCGPPEGMFELGEEMGGAWRCVRNLILLLDIFYFLSLSCDYGR